MAYRDDVLALNPDHYWTFDGTHNDIGVGPSAPRNTGQSGGNTAAVTGPAITEDASNSLTVGSATQRTECADSAQINSATQARRTMGGWFRPNEISRPPSSIYKEGGGTNNMCVFLGFGNVVLAQVVDANDFDIQAYSDRPLTPNRAYHLCFVFSGNGFNNEFYLLVDGVRQNITTPSPPAPDRSTLASHGADINWGDPDTNLNVGGNGTGFAGALGQHAHWASWTINLTDSQIRDELFEKGAIPTHTITNQAGLDALADTLVSETPLAIRVDVAGNIDLEADNVTFSEASIHVQYTGTGILNWTNTNGSNASISSSPNGGTVNVITGRTLTIEGLDDGSTVRIFDNQGGTLLFEQNATAGQVNYPYLYSGPETVYVVYTDLDTKIQSFDKALSDQNETVTLFALTNRQYENL